MPLRKASTTSPSSSIFSSFPATLNAFYGRVASLRDDLDVRGLGALRPLARLELHLRALGQRLEALAGDLREVDEHVLAAALRLDEAVALRVVEPLDGSGRHLTNTSPTCDRTSREGAHVRAAEHVLVFARSVPDYDRAMRIRAAVLEEFGAPLAVQEVELADPRRGEALVRLVACGVCHTDLYTASGADPSGYAPAVLGHEGAGVVERVGEGVRDVAPGDHVVTLFSPQCREGAHCRDPRTNLCLAIREEQGRGPPPDGTTRLSRDGEPIRHFMGTSTFAEYTVMPEIALARVSPEAPLDRACLFACGLSTGLGAAMNTAKVATGSTCVVFGAGMVGLGAVAGCRLRGAERIVAIDLSNARLELAEGQGATETLVGGPDVVQ